MFQQESMVVVDRMKLLTTLVANQSDHAEKVERARGVYRQRIVEELDERLEAAKRGEDVDPGFLHKLPIPADYTIEYIRAIDQYTWDVRPEIELTRTEFNRYIRDEWEWTERFFATNAGYGIR